MFNDTRPAALDDAGPDAWAAFRVNSPNEMTALLRQLRDGSVPLVLSAPSGAAVVSTLWSVDLPQRRLNFAVDDGDPQLRELAESDEAVCVG
jgi:flagellar brake protein